jgi:hypothetical protein
MRPSKRKGQRISHYTGRPCSRAEAPIFGFGSTCAVAHSANWSASGAQAFRFMLKGEDGDQD